MIPHAMIFVVVAPVVEDAGKGDSTLHDRFDGGDGEEEEDDAA